MERQFLVVVGPPRDLHADGADDDHACTVATDFAGEHDGIVGAGRGADENAVYATAVAQHRDGASDIPLAVHPCIRSKLEGQGDLSVVEIDAEHLAARRPQELRRDLADQSEADDGESLAERRRRRSDALERDRTNREEGGRVIADAVGNLRAEFLGNEVHFRVVRHLRARAGNPVADGDSGDALPHRNYTTGAAVAQRDGLIEPVEDGSAGREQAVARESF